MVGRVKVGWKEEEAGRYGCIAGYMLFRKWKYGIR